MQEANGSGTPVESVATTPPTTRDFLKMACGFWSGDTAGRAWTYTLTILGLVLVNISIAYALNRWNRWFFDALEKHDFAAITPAIAIFAGLIVSGAICVAILTKVRMTLQMQWRSWVTDRLLTRWLGEQRYYKLAISDDTVTSIEGRITDDVRLAIEPVPDFVTGFFNAVLSALTFAGVLYFVGGSITIGSVTIPGYIALAAVAYAIVVSSATVYIGNPLSSAVDRRNETEAQFRFGLARVRENVESIALIRGDEDELRRSRESFESVSKATADVIRNHRNLQLILNANSFFAGTFALLLALPKYMSGDLTLGALVQLGAAFTAVLAALNWFAENFIPIAQWRASALRVSLLNVAFRELDQETAAIGGTKINVVAGETSDLSLRNVSVRQRDGATVVDGADIVIATGERVLLAGESGTGKSTLIRAVAGLWPWGAGEVVLPKDAVVEFMPQRPYIPPGTLRDVIAYPQEGTSLSNDEAMRLLQETGLGYMKDRLDEVAEYDKSLSGGERQRVAFARLMLLKPTVIVMDEATAALDVDSETRLLTLLFERLPEATVLSVGHRPGLDELHTRKLTLKRMPRGARISEAKPRIRWRSGRADKQGGRGIRALLDWKSRLRRAPAG